MSLFTLLLILHIAGGTVSLLLGLYIILAKKANRLHVLLGNVFFYAMLLSALVALPLSYLHPNYFLFIIGVFTSYMLLTGKRAIGKKTVADVHWPDWLLSGIMLLFGLAFMAYGSYLLYRGNSFGIVLLVFGSISLFFVVQDTINFRGKSRFANNWLSTHIQRMTGSYIASVTAFLVVNNTLLPGIVAWLAPTILLTPLIIIWTRKYKGRKLEVVMNYP